MTPEELASLYFAAMCMAHKNQSSVAGVLFRLAEKHYESMDKKTKDRVKFHRDECIADG